MPTPMAARRDDLFVTRGETPRVRGRNKALSDRRTPPVPVTKPEEAQARMLEQRRQPISAILANDTVGIVFQPIVDLRTGIEVGAEALARFEAPSLRSPDAWFAEAKAVGLGVELEMAAIRSALDQLGRLPSGLYLSLNASPDTIMSSEFRAVVGDVAAERVVLELTEPDSIDDYVGFEGAVNELRYHGVRLAVDDAGAGLSTFRLIVNLHPDVIKHDVRLTRGTEADPARRALGQALLAFGLDAFDGVVVAEGIETQGEFSTLRGQGYRYGQGYYLGRPSSLWVPGSRPADPEACRLAGERQEQPISTLEIEVDGGATPQSDQAHEARVPPRDEAPIGLKEKLERALHQKEETRDVFDDLLDLVVEIQSRSGRDSDSAQGRRSFVRTLLAR